MTLLRHRLLSGSIALAMLTFLALPVPARAQTGVVTSVGSVFSLAATNLDGVRFDAAALQGNVSVVFFWSTGCAVCRDSLPELRANLSGWRNKPFMLVVANVDRQAADWLSYERVLGKFKAPTKGYVSVRQDDGVPLPSRLPLTLLLDAKGKVLQRIEGRVAPEIWDGVAELF